MYPNLLRPSRPMCWKVRGNIYRKTKKSQKQNLDAPVQRQRLPSSPSSISAELAEGLDRRRAYRAMTMPAKMPIPTTFFETTKTPQPGKYKTGTTYSVDSFGLAGSIDRAKPMRVPSHVTFCVTVWTRSGHRHRHRHHELLYCSCLHHFFAKKKLPIHVKPCTRTRTVTPKKKNHRNRSKKVSMVCLPQTLVTTCVRRVRQRRKTRQTSILYTVVPSPMLPHLHTEENAGRLASKKNAPEAVHRVFGSV